VATNALQGDGRVSSLQLADQLNQSRILGGRERQIIGAFKFNA